MHPAGSVILFTAASGAGYGLLFLLGLFGASGVLAAERGLGIAAFGLAFSLVSAGLLSSTFHLGHPERAWRAVTQWRSSWLAREGVMAILAYIPALGYAFGWIVWGQTFGFWGWLGAFTSLSAALTVVCTAMIYRSLRPLFRWSNAWTLPSYLALGLMTGALWLSALIHFFGIQAPAVDGTAALAVAAGWVIKTGYWSFIDQTPAPSTQATATGLRLDRVRLVEVPHGLPNFLNKEMGFKVKPVTLRSLRSLAHGFGFAIPLVLCLIVLSGGGWAALPAALAATLGIAVERWLLFAEARHSVNLYYGATSV
jgi:DMSO reductase anchor subunit